MTDATSEQLAALERKCAQLTQERDTLRIGRLIAESNFANERCALPSVFVASVLAPHFKLEGDKPIAHDEAGKQLWSVQKPGHLADLNEAVEILLSRHPNKQFLLKGVDNGSNSAEKDAGQPAPDKKALTRREFEKLAPHQRGGFLKNGGRIVES